MEADVLNVVIRSREGIVYQGECRSVSSFNKIGKFDILGSHANFITLVQKEINVIEKNGSPLTFKVDNGVAKVKENKVQIYLGVRQTLEKA
jgi:F0F1-type ATP synthase epsilon subunit